MRLEETAAAAPPSAAAMASPSSSATITEDDLTKLKSDLKRVRGERNELKVELQTTQYELAQREDDREDEVKGELEVLQKRVSQLSIERLNLQERVSSLEQTAIKGSLPTQDAGQYNSTIHCFYCKLQTFLVIFSLVDMS